MNVVTGKCGEIFLPSTQKCGSIQTFKLISETWLMGIPCVYIYIPLDILGAIYWLRHTSIDTVQN